MQKVFGCANQLLQQLPRGLVSGDNAGEEAGCEGPGLMCLHVLCSCEGLLDLHLAGTFLQSDLL